MIATSASSSSSASHIGAPPKPWMLISSHQVPSPKVPAPKQKPSQAARRGAAPSHSHISTAGHRIANGHSCSGANAQASSAPARQRQRSDARAARHSGGAVGVELRR